MAEARNLNLYLVSEGAVAPATAETECDGTNSILVAATSKDAALKVTEAYDRGLVAADNMEWDGKTISVVMLRDEETGMPVYTVKADRATGQWIGEPEDTGRVTTCKDWYWASIRDTDAVHYDTYEHPIDSTTSETRAIEVHFVG